MAAVTSGENQQLEKHGYGKWTSNNVILLIASLGQLILLGHILSY